jgi:hypothetical protein
MQHAIDVSLARCDALVISPGTQDIEHVLLPNFSQETAMAAHSQYLRQLQSDHLIQPGERRPIWHAPRGDNHFEVVLAI